jgi:hypothetical protein
MTVTMTEHLDLRCLLRSEPPILIGRIIVGLKRLLDGIVEEPRIVLTRPRAIEGRSHIELLAVESCYVGRVVRLGKRDVEPHDSVWLGEGFALARRRGQAGRRRSR